MTNQIRLSGRVAAAAVVAGIGIAAAIALGRPDVIPLVVPVVAATAVGLARAPRPPDARVRAWVDGDRVLEGDQVDVVVELSGLDQPVVADLRFPPLLGLTVTGDLTHQLEPTAATRATVALRAPRWGAQGIGPLEVRLRQPDGWIVAETSTDPVGTVKVYPSPEQLRRLVRPADTQAYAGNQLARVAGDGIEFADVRPFVPGDRIKEVNWRVAARRPGLWVTERHPERNTDVVVFLDAFDRDGLDDVVRLATSLVSAYVADRDRVGVVSFGGVMHWIRPGMGMSHHYRVLDALIGTEAFDSAAWKSLTLIPPRVLPPKALVIALSPLLDDRVLEALVDLRRRGIDVVVVEVGSSDDDSTEPTDEPGRLARRLWALQRDSIRTSLRSLGATVVPWQPDTPLQATIEEVRQYRRAARVRA